MADIKVLGIDSVTGQADYIDAGEKGLNLPVGSTAIALAWGAVLPLTSIVSDGEYTITAGGGVLAGTSSSFWTISPLGAGATLTIDGVAAINDPVTQANDIWNRPVSRLVRSGNNYAVTTINEIHANVHFTAATTIPAVLTGVGLADRPKGATNARQCYNRGTTLIFCLGTASTYQDFLNAFNSNSGLLVANYLTSVQLSIGSAYAAVATLTDAMPVGEYRFFTDRTSCYLMRIPGGASTGLTGGYLLADLSADTATPTVAVNNHCPFNRVTNSVGSAISLDTASAYSNVNNTASIGRFTIAANTTVSMRGFISTISYTVGVSYLGFTWYNADTGVAIGIEGGASNGVNTDNNVSQMLAIASITTGASPVRVELRLTGLGGTMTQWYSGNVNIPGSWAELSVESATAPTIPTASPISLNNSNSTFTDGLYSVAMAHFNTNTFEFFQDSFFRFQLNAGNFQITAVGVARGIGVYGQESNSSTSVNTMPIGTDPDFAGRSGYLNTVNVGTFVNITNGQAISTDFDDIQIYWIQTPSASVCYRVTIMGGNTLKAVVERWNHSLLTVNTKITLPN